MEPSWPTTDVNRVKRLPEGDPSVWDWFAQAYGPIIHRMLRGLGLQASDADDVAQEVLSKMYRANYQGRGRFRAFLRITIRNACRDHFRKAKRRPIVSGKTSVRARFEDLASPDADDALDREYQQHLLESAVQDLAAEFNPVHWDVYRRLQAGEERAAVAARHGLSEGNTRTIQSRITRRIKSRVQELEDAMEARLRKDAVP